MTEAERVALEKKIEDWHFNGAGADQDLWEYLGWTREMYWDWASTGRLPE